MEPARRLQQKQLSQRRFHWHHCSCCCRCWVGHYMRGLSISMCWKGSQAYSTRSGVRIRARGGQDQGVRTAGKDEDESGSKQLGREKAYGAWGVMFSGAAEENKSGGGAE